MWGPSSFLRNSVLGKLLLVSLVVAMTMCHRIAGIVALIFVIALLNMGAMEGFALDNSTSSSSSPLFGSTAATTAPAAPATPAQFRQQYCTRGVTDPLSPPEKFSYLLSPTLFTDDKGKPKANSDLLNMAQKINFASMNKCTPEKPGSTNFATVQNICDPSCNWTMNPAPTSPMATATTNTPTSEGFTPMSTLRPHIRTGNKMIAKGMEQFKLAANHIKRKLF